MEGSSLQKKFYRLELVDDCVENGTDSAKESLFSAVFDGMKGMSTREWDERLASYLLPLCSLSSCRKRMEAFLQEKVRAYEGPHNTYMQIKIKKMQLDLIRRHDGDQAVALFILDNLQYDEFRVMAIDTAKQRGDYQEVLTLAQEGVHKDGHVGGSSWKWQQHAFYAYRAMGNLPCARELARRFLMDGRFEYYEWLKQSAAKGDWEEEAQGILVEMEARRYPGVAYEQMLVAEAQWECLMGYVERETGCVFELHEHLAGRFQERIDAVFRKAITNMAAGSTDRSAYKTLCARIRVYDTACGQIAAEEIIHMLRENYRRRPAMLDELSKAFPY